MTNTNTAVAVITGASRGLGLALARALAAEGYSLVLDARDGGALRAAAASLPAGHAVAALRGDITDPAHRAELRRAADDLGGPSLLINNAGTLGESPLPALADYPIDGLRDAFEVNPRVLVEVLVLSGEEGVDNPLWDRLDRDEDATFGGEFGQQSSIPGMNAGHGRRMIMRELLVVRQLAVELPDRDADHNATGDP